MSQTLDISMDMGAMGERLMEHGMTAQSAKKKELLFSACLLRAQDFGTANTSKKHAWFVPGRIEVLGKHTDYAGGRSLTAAVERGFCAVSVPRQDNTVQMIDVHTGHTTSFALTPDLAPTQAHWSNYPMTVGRRLARNFSGQLKGADITFISDLPPAAGMSSSSALIVLSYLILARMNHLEERPEYRHNIHSLEELAGYLGTIENGQNFGTLIGDKGVGTFGGSEDHTAILCSRSRHLSLYSYCPVRFERAIEVAAEYTFVIGVSGVVAEKTGTAKDAYNQASTLASAVTEMWRKTTGRRDPHLAAVVSSSDRAPNQVREMLARASSLQSSAKALLNRFEQFWQESEKIIPAAGNALEAGDVNTFGHYVAQSQDLTERLLGNQVPETVFLARAAKDAGAIAASAFGAGFGGSVWALVRTQQAEEFMGQWAQLYCAAFPQLASRAQFFSTQAGPAAISL